MIAHFPIELPDSLPGTPRAALEAEIAQIAGRIDPDRLWLLWRMLVICMPEARAMGQLKETQAASDDGLTCAHMIAALQGVPPKLPMFQLVMVWQAAVQIGSHEVSGLSLDGGEE